MREELLDGLSFFPKFEAPPNLLVQAVLEYVEEHLAAETPIAFGLHPNSEINFMTRGRRALRVGRRAAAARGGGGGGMTLQEKVKRILDDILEKLPEPFVA